MKPPDQQNPYQSPSAITEDTPEGTKEALGRPCPACGSLNTSRDSVLRARPSILFVIFFGWVFLLIRGAFAMRRSQCRDCGEVTRYKSAGSWVALGLLILLTLICALAMVCVNDPRFQPKYRSSHGIHTPSIKP